MKSKEYIISQIKIDLEDNKNIGTIIDGYNYYIRQGIGTSKMSYIYDINKELSQVKSIYSKKEIDKIENAYRNNKTIKYFIISPKTYRLLPFQSYSDLKKYLIDNISYIVNSIIKNTDNENELFTIFQIDRQIITI